LLQALQLLEGCF